jgi:hypothetical protein
MKAKTFGSTRFPPGCSATASPFRVLKFVARFRTHSGVRQAAALPPHQSVLIRFQQVRGAQLC